MPDEMGDDIGVGFASCIDPHYMDRMCVRFPILWIVE